MSRTGKIALVLAAGFGVVACVFLTAVLVGHGLPEAGVWAGVLGVPVAVMGSVAAVWAVVPRRPRILLPPVPTVPDWMIERPAELAAVVTALTGRQADAVGITTGLDGAGGFGKTTLASMACADRRVRRRFGGRVYFVTIGRDVRGPEVLAAKVNDVIKLVTGEVATFTDPQLAGQRLGALLDAGPRSLLVLDDVWEPGQLAPFTDGGRQCARLVTTRAPGLLGGRGVAVRVDQMSVGQARALLTSGLPPLEPMVGDGLVAVTGRWPLLLRLVHGILEDYARAAPDVSAMAAALLERLRAGGPAVVDDVLGDFGRGLDVGQSRDRALAVRATIEASTSLLNRGDADRLAELGVFAEDEVIPFSLLARLWRATAGLDDLESAQVRKRLVRLALVSDASSGGGIALHDVVRNFLRAELGERLAAVHGMLLHSVAADLPSALPPGLSAQDMAGVAWWQLGDDDQYLWDHVIEHMLDAGRPDHAEAIACDLRWAGARLERFGPVAPAADLSRIKTPKAAHLRMALGRSAHLLAPTEPAEAVVDILHSRVADDPGWGPQVAALRGTCHRPRLMSLWPLPDLPEPALRRILKGHALTVSALAAAPDGSWLASGGQDRTVRIWDVTTGNCRAVLTGHTSWVYAVAVAPDGTWLASSGDHQKLRIWDAATGHARAVLRSGPYGGLAVAMLDEGSWLLYQGGDRSVRKWNATTGQSEVLLGRKARVHLVAAAADGSWLAVSMFDSGTQLISVWPLDDDGHPEVADDKRRGDSPKVLEITTGQAVAVAPDGSWLASGGYDGTVRIWDTATGEVRVILDGHTGLVSEVVAASDGSWLASGGQDGTVRTWDTAAGDSRAVMAGHAGGVTALAMPPDGTWLASGGHDGTVRIWDTAAGDSRASPRTAVGRVEAVAGAPDGTWLASGNWDGTVRIWDVATGQPRSVLTGHGSSVKAIAIAPDGTWLASGSVDGTVRIWDVATGQARPVLTGHGSWVKAIAIAPDGTWLASGSFDGTVRIWDARAGNVLAVLKTYPGAVDAVAAAPDGTWLATGCEDCRVRIWNLSTTKVRAVLKGHTKWVRAVSVAPDGSWLASGGDDGMIRIWDTATGKAREILQGHAGSVQAVTISPDGSLLASSGSDGAIRIWDVPTSQILTMTRLDGSITAGAWLSAGTITAGGSAGLYLLDFGTAPRPM